MDLYLITPSGLQRPLDPHPAVRLPPVGGTFPSTGSVVPRTQKTKAATPRSATWGDAAFLQEVPQAVPWQDPCGGLGGGGTASRKNHVHYYTAAVHNQQLIVAIEGLDKAGKQTQSRMLGRALAGEDITSKLFHFPNYRTLIGNTIARHLASRHRRGEAPAPQALHCLQAANKWDELGRINDACQGYDVVIMDRYYASNRAYGAAKGLDPGWLANLEDGLPQADVTILLDISVEESFKRRPDDRDTFERDKEFLEGVRAGYDKMAKREGWAVIPADRPRDEVHRDILESLMPVIRKSLLAKDETSAGAATTTAAAKDTAWKPAQGKRRRKTAALERILGRRRGPQKG